METRTLKKQSPPLITKQPAFKHKNSQLAGEITVMKLQGNACKSRSYLAHLQLEEAPFFLHLFCDLSSCDLCPDHPVLLRMLSFLLLNLCAVVKADTVIKKKFSSFPPLTRASNCFLFTRGKQQKLLCW